MQKRKFDELISHFNRKVSDMSIDQKYKMELLGMISAIGFAHEKELGTNLASLGTDCISRQAAIDAIEFDITYAKAINKETGEVTQMFERENKALEDAVERVRQLPPIQPEPHWIPVTEPPTDRTICYVTLKDTNDENRQNWVVEMIYTPWDGFDLMDGIEAIAWMPKQYPEPYKGVTDGNQNT